MHWWLGTSDSRHWNTFNYLPSASQKHTIPVRPPPHMTGIGTFWLQCHCSGICGQDRRHEVTSTLQTTLCLSCDTNGTLFAHQESKTEVTHRILIDLYIVSPPFVIQFRSIGQMIQGDVFLHNVVVCLLCIWCDSFSEWYYSGDLHVKSNQVTITQRAAYWIYLSLKEKRTTCYSQTNLFIFF